MGNVNPFVLYQRLQALEAQIESLGAERMLVKLALGEALSILAPKAEGASE